MIANLIAIAGVPPTDMSGKLVGVGCPCAGGQGIGAEDAMPLPTEEQASAMRWTAVALLGLAAVGLWWMESRRHA